MSRIVAVVAVIACLLLGGALYITNQNQKLLREQHQAQKVQMDDLLEGKALQDNVIAQFARIWPDMHVLRVSIAKEDGDMNLLALALAGNDTLSIKCLLNDGELEHNLGDVLLGRTGILLVPVTALANEPGGNGNVSVNAPQGMRVEIRDVTGDWAKVLIDGKEGFMPLSFFSLRPASFFIRPFSQAGHNPTDRLGLTPDTLLRRYFAAYVAADFNRVADYHAHYPQPSRAEYIDSLKQAREHGYRVWGYEVGEILMINQNEAAVLVRYTWTSTGGRSTTSSDWWRVLRVNGEWKVAWFPRV